MRSSTSTCRDKDAFSMGFAKPRGSLPKGLTMATYDFKLPDIGEGVVEGEIVKWLVKEGELVQEDQPLVEVMTDKATVTIPCPKNGKVLKTHGAEGDIAKVHQPLVTLELAEAATAGANGNATPARPSAPPDITAEVRAAKPTPGGAVSDALGTASDTSRVLATPVTRRMAR